MPPYLSQLKICLIFRAVAELYANNSDWIRTGGQAYYIMESTTMAG